MMQTLVLLATLISISTTVATNQESEEGGGGDIWQALADQLYRFQYPSNACLEKQRRYPDVFRSHGKGENISRDAVNLTESVLGGTNDLLFKIAWVESRFGEHSGTYRRGYYGGIFQVDRKGFQATQDVRSHPGLRRKFQKIERAFCIKWRDVRWWELRKPLYSAIAARLFLSNKPGAIPSSLKGQALYWKNYYNSGAGAGTATKFLNRWKKYVDMKKGK